MKAPIKKIVVVGDAFREFAEVPGVMTYSSFMRWAANEPSAPHRIHLGQGLSAEERRRIASLRASFRICSGADALPSRLTHKHRAENVAITEPVPCPEEDERYRYEAWLVVDDGCAELSDHLTGEHLQGTLIAEAARQMVIAVNERYFCSPERPGVRFVTHATNVSYHEYLFPIPTKVVYRKLKLRAGLGGNYRASARIDFIQNDRCQATVELHFSVLDGKFLRDQERLLAEQAVASCLA